MSKNPDSVRKLRARYRDRLSVPDLIAMKTELMAGSDRSLIITLGAFLDSALEYVLLTRMRPETTLPELEDLFGPSSPLGSFSARIRLAYLLALIDAPVRDQLNDIRELRNVSAHSRHAISFSTPELANVAKRVIHPKGSFRAEGNSPDAIKAAFTAECLFLHGVLLWGREKAIEEVRASYQKQGMQPPF